MDTSLQADSYFLFDNSYARLPDRFFARLAPTPVSAPRLIRLNTPLARSLDLDPEKLSSPQGIEILAGNLVPDGAEPLAMAYAGHQFGNWVPQLGDGRAILLGEVIDAGGARHDIQLKGAGRTPFSRGGDGRAALGPILREFIISEAMAALGIPTTRALAAVTTGEPVIRETRLPGAVLTRVAKSHIRIGTFQYFAARDDVDALRILGDHVIARLYPDAAGEPNPYLSLLEQIIARQADLVAHWMHVGFIHGVMNTDNMSIAGETIDYGPCAFMDTHHSDTVFSSIDQMGRYAYGNQPQIAHWNLVCLAQTLIPLLGDRQEAAIEAAQEAVNRFPEQFEAAWLKGMRKKLGLTDARDGDLKLAQDLLQTMAGHGADFTQTFRQLYHLVDNDVDAGKRPHQSVFDNNDAPGDWECRWWQRLENEARERGDQVEIMRTANPTFIPRNHLVEEAISAALNEDFDPFEILMSVLSRPYEDQPDRQSYAMPPTPEKIVHQTFCGT